MHSKLFADKFGLDKFRNLDGELLIETVLNVSNKGGLAYWLEFKNDDEFKTSTVSDVIKNLSDSAAIEDYDKL